MDGSKRREARAWAYEEFGHAELGDTRRTMRLVRMAASLAERPGGKILDVFRSSAEQQGAYDFLSNEKVRSGDMLEAMGGATARRCADEPWVHVVVDGTSLRLTDYRRTKDFGAVGSTNNGASGLKVVHGYAVSGEVFRWGCSISNGGHVRGERSARTANTGLWKTRRPVIG